MNHKKHWDELEERLVEIKGYFGPEYESGIRVSIEAVQSRKESMLKEYAQEKKITNSIWWAGIPLFIYFLYGLVAGSKENAYEFLDIASWVYAFFAALVIGEKITNGLN